MPKNGSAMMYTSGCPKNQNRCCQRIVPPFAGSSRWDSNTRSAPRAKSPAARTGNARSTRIEVTSVFQVKIGIRNIVMPGARIVMIVVMKLTAPRIVPKPLSARPKTQRFPPRPGLKVVLDSGV